MVSSLTPIFYQVPDIKSSLAMITKLREKKEVNAGSILMSYGVNPHNVKLPIFSEFMENTLHIKSMYLFEYFAGLEITFGKNTVYLS